MKKLLLLVFISGFLFSCSDDDDSIEKEPEIVNTYKTGQDLSKSYSTLDSYSLANEPFNALGYGYDITGKYAHPDWIRKKIVDPQEYENDHYYDVVRDRSYFYHRGLGIRTGTKQDITKQMLVRINSDTDNLSQYKNVLKGMFELPFENDTTFSDAQYYYSVDAFVSSWYLYEFYTSDASELYNYLTKEFKADLLVKSAKEIINKYGTHVLMSIETGVRQDYYFRATSDQEMEKRMVYNSARYFSSTPGIWMEPAPKEYVDKENIYTEFIGGVHTYPNAWMFDITNYNEGVKLYIERKDAEKSNIVLVNFGSQLRSIIPIYEFIEDPIKRKAIEEEYISYLRD